MIRRLLIVLAIAAGVVFVPYWVGTAPFYREWLQQRYPYIYPNFNIVEFWIFGFGLIMLIVAALGLLFVILSLAIPALVHYIKHGTK